MEENARDQAFFFWVNEKKKILTFRPTKGYKKVVFSSQEEKLACVYRLCESGYRIL